jgi:hypothetical protein
LLLCRRLGFVLVVMAKEPSEQAADEVCRRDLVEAAPRPWLDEHLSSLPPLVVSGSSA